MPTQQPMMMQNASMTVSKEMVRLRLYALCLAGDMAGLFCAFLAANSALTTLI